MNEIINVPMTSQRDVKTITAEIQTLQAQTQRLVLEYSIEVGRRLTEVKSMIPYGEWGTYLKEELSFSQSTANNLMRIFDEYGDDQIGLLGANAKSQALGKLSYTKALQLLAIPAEERESFAEEHDIEHKSTREIDALIKERDAALAAQKAAEDELKERRLDIEAADRALAAAKKADDERAAAVAAAEEAKKKLAEAEARAEKAKEREKKAKTDLQALKDNPTVPPEVLEKYQAEAEASAKAAAEQELEEKTADLRAEVEKALQNAEEADKAAKEAQVALENAKKALTLSSPEMTAFQIRFKTVQNDFKELLDCLDQVKTANPETGEKMTAAVNAVLQAFTQQIGG